MTKRKDVNKKHDLSGIQPDGQTGSEAPVQIDGCALSTVDNGFQPGRTQSGASFCRSATASESFCTWLPGISSVQSSDGSRSKTAKSHDMFFVWLVCFKQLHEHPSRSAPEKRKTPATKLCHKAVHQSTLSHAEYVTKETSERWPNAYYPAVEPFHPATKKTQEAKPLVWWDKRRNRPMFTYVHPLLWPPSKASRFLRARPWIQHGSVETARAF